MLWFMAIMGVLITVNREAWRDRAASQRTTTDLYKSYLFETEHLGHIQEAYGSWKNRFILQKSTLPKSKTCGRRQFNLPSKQQKDAPKQSNKALADVPSSSTYAAHWSWREKFAKMDADLERFHLMMFAKVSPGHLRSRLLHHTDRILASCSFILLRNSPPSVGFACFARWNDCMFGEDASQFVKGRVSWTLYEDACCMPPRNSSYCMFHACGQISCPRALEPLSSHSP